MAVMQSAPLNSAKPTWGLRLSFGLLSLVLRNILRLFFSFEVKGREHLRYEQVILAGNHTGFLDSPALIAAFDFPMRFMVAQMVFSWPIVGWIVKNSGMIPVAPGKEKQALTESIRDLKAGKVIGIFPEGKITPDGELCEFRRGVGLIQKHSQATIIPFAIQGGFDAWHWGQWFPKFVKVTIQFGEPIPPSDRNDHEIVAELRQRVEGMLGEANAREFVMDAPSLKGMTQRQVS